MFEKGKWIYKPDGCGADEYVQFLDSFEGGDGCLLKIAADSNYAVWVNGRLAAFGQYADYPYYKVCDEVDISAYKKQGVNTLAVLLWYYGIDSQTYILGKAGLIYEVSIGKEVRAYSGTHTLCRKATDYISGLCHEISGQLGLSYHCDMKGCDGWKLPGYAPKGFVNAAEVDGISYDFTPRPIKKLELRERMNAKIIQRGTFTYSLPLKSTQENMQYAPLSFRYPSQLCGGRFEFSSPVEFKAGEGEQIYFIVDLGSETSGFLDFDITVPEAADMEVGYGEHLIDGRCRTSIRDFSADFKLRAGRNEFLNTFRRFGCRYVQFFIHCSSAVVAYAGLRPTVYPVTPKTPDTGNYLRDVIYSVCENTLLQCMHEHYEDCPWREQALYTMDSRNQMLCGYYAFGEYAFPRACLKLISKGMRDDGLLTLCYPAGRDFPIPSFSLIYFIQNAEYIKYSGDITLAREIYPVLQRLINTFLSRISDSGLCGCFYGQDAHGNYPYWNFYEWSDTMSGCFGTCEPSVEAPLNADLSLALQSLSKISLALGKNEDAEKYAEKANELNEAIYKAFYNPVSGLFRTFTDKNLNLYSVLTNSLCLLCGAGERAEKGRILEILSRNGGEIEGGQIIPNTLSMNSFRFDALLAADFDKYKPVILSELDRDYLYMLREGATTFWETIKGAGDFGDAGSLCHGWSALPIYYYEILK